MSEHNPFGPFSIPEIRDFVPEKLKPFVIILFLVIIQFSGGVYVASASEMVGTTAFMNEDIQMAGLSSLVGMALNFVYMFRLKCAIPPKSMFFICGFVIIIANIICMYTTCVPLLVGTCFVAGFFRMQATFQCNSTIQLWLTPKRDLSVFFCWVYLIVNGSINLSGLQAVYLSSFAEWEMMQWSIIGMILFMLLLVQTLMRNHSSMPRIPFLGIDYIGMLMWGSSALCALFICIYGEHYDWWTSEYIWAATIACVVLVALSCWRASFIRHPYIFLDTFKHPIIWLCPVSYIVADILLAPEHVFEHALMEGILGYDALHLASLNWISILGVATGVLFTWQTFAVRKWRYRTMLLISFCCIGTYLFYFYFKIDYNLPKEALMFPIFARNFGYVTLAITVLTANTRMPFPFHFFQGVTIQNVFSAALGSAIGCAIIGRALKVTMAKNAMLISSGIDNVNGNVQHIPLGEIYGIVQQQALMVSMKEIYGWLGLACIAVIFALLLRKEHLSKPIRVTHPKFKTIRRMIKHELRVSKENASF